MHKTLIVTNDFPPRPGGIQAFLHNMALRLDPERLVVYASTWKRSREGAEATAAFDAEQPFTVVRDRTTMLLPTPAVTRRAAGLLREHGCTSVWFGAAAPLGLMAPALRRAGAERLVATTHGHEAGWARLPASRQLLRRIGDSVDTVTYLGEYTRSRIAPALTPAAAERMTQLPPGVDEKTFHPGSGGAEVRARLGLSDRPVVVCVSRLVPRKGQDTLILALPRVLAAHPDAVLLIVGGGPYERDLRRLARETGVAGSVRFTGSVPWEELPAHYGAGDVFAMPCRTRRGGLDVEGLGIVYLEASATGLPVLAGDSGGAPDAVLDGETGWVVRGGAPAEAAERINALLADEELRRRMGERGRRWVEEKWRWDLLAERLRALL
ncbi:MULTISPECIES: glycosyltransferase family 4 protein [Streptomyces]|jgi:phosphatidylinositol alpha-1,6-mannosyltransferase|uniref:phosphatidyl-myo-inositol dimannoside synthase n=3 Tax=Streptomyces griseoaurantiacus TaxID=68213 RepID=F3NRK1_9ACTN|nr:MULTISPECIES: glycosyltransferase family 4 protein [Streptomyces]EGG44185.1 glycosyl transferase [Streptomyces griseoaurantiacus M045]MBA5222401.1 glycosyltransferase family 4 protein [Streptomyces griseoaurantiacus]MCF0090537.1 GDP-mannose-dependent alpha-(1-6)-phosphatidylinositol monomannoside mannosyltransferase [Streptomyces sp. MH192]MCF0102867.1 GDP-mannose-dependent alpha-(1-6)-phosphatidylinositol monomannoside mannosyltransferase [Streptomyces sp. MH191]MDX3091803.1 glycosyltransf